MQQTAKHCGVNDHTVLIGLRAHSLIIMTGATRPGKPRSAEPRARPRYTRPRSIPFLMA